MSPGKFIYTIYHKPLDNICKLFKTGVTKTIRIKSGVSEMTAASRPLREVVYLDQPAYPVYFLTGKNYWFQTAFCLHSLQLHAGVNIHAFIVDDGSFDDNLEAEVKMQFPSTVTVIRSAEIKKLLDEKLPEANFPVLRQRRIVYPHLRKLTDVHILPGAGPKLVLDSDMLFFHKPVELLAWLANPVGFLFMLDVEESYGYTNGLMKKLTQKSGIPHRLNVGVAGMASAKIDWEKLEAWTAGLLEEEGSSYLQEQALTAMLAAGENIQFLDEQSYKVLPKIVSENIPEILHHYVADAKYDYFVKGWKLHRH